MPERDPADHHNLVAAYYDVSPDVIHVINVYDYYGFYDDYHDGGDK